MGSTYVSLPHWVFFYHPVVGTVAFQILDVLLNWRSLWIESSFGHESLELNGGLTLSVADLAEVFNAH